MSVLDPPANVRSSPESAGTRSKASFIQIHDGLVGLLGFVAASDEVFTSSGTLGFETLGLEQRFSVADAHALERGGAQF